MFHRLALRFRGSHHFAAPPHANFGNTRSTSNFIISSAVYEFEIPAMDLPRNWQEFQIHRTSPAQSTETLTQPRQHVLTVKFQEACLVRSRRVEHQIAETETDIVAD